MQGPNPLIKARDRTLILMDTSRISFHCTTVAYIIFLILPLGPQVLKYLLSGPISEKLTNLCSKRLTLLLLLLLLSLISLGDLYFHSNFIQPTFLQSPIGIKLRFFI